MTRSVMSTALARHSKRCVLRKVPIMVSGKNFQNNCYGPHNFRGLSHERRGSEVGGVAREGVN